MRLLVAALALLVVLPAQAQDWTPYTDPIAGFTLTFPPQFKATGESVAGSDTGTTFATADQTLQVWSGTADIGTFTSEMSQREGVLTDQGWTEEESYAEADYAGFIVDSDQGGRTITSYAVPLCDGTKFAAFQLEYATKDAEDWDEVANNILDSMDEGDC